MSASQPTKAKPPPGRRWKLLRRCLQGVLVLIALVIGGWLLFRWHCDAKLAAAVANIDTEESRWRIGELEADRATVPDDQNGALLVLQATAKLPPKWPPQQLWGGGISRVRPVERLTPEHTAL